MMPGTAVRPRRSTIRRPAAGRGRVRAVHGVDELQRQLGLTAVMVTHDQEEALTMADRLVVMNEGAVRQVGTQRDLYERPADRFVAGFVGRSTFLAGTIEATEARYAIMFRKGNDAVRRAVDQVLAQVKVDGTYDRLYERWFGWGRWSVSST